MFDAFDTHGGHMVVCLILILVGAAFIKFGIPEGRDLIVGFAAIAGRSMYGSAERTAARDTTSSTTTSTSTIVEPTKP